LIVVVKTPSVADYNYLNIQIVGKESLSFSVHDGSQKIIPYVGISVTVMRYLHY